jgi:hypothetical protein
MSELSILELEAQHGEVLPEREALSVGVAIGSFNHRTTINHNTTTNTATTHTTSVSASNSSTSAVANSFLSSSRSSATQSVSVVG